MASSDGKGGGHANKRQRVSEDKSITTASEALSSTLTHEKKLLDAIEVNYEPELNVVLSDAKLLESLPGLQCWGCRSLVWQCEVPPCEHVACHGCVDNLFSTPSEDGSISRKCPLCKQEFSRAQWEPLSPLKHKFLIRCLSGIKIKCPEFQHMGCNVIVDYSEAKSHLEKTCKWSITKCEFCSKKFKTCDMAKHGLVCKRRQKCPHCALSIISDEVVAHELICPKLPRPCPNKCSPDLYIAKSLDEHMLICPASLEACPIPTCPMKLIARKDLCMHLSDIKLHSMSSAGQPNAEMVEAACLLGQKLSQIHDQARLYPVAFCSKMHLMPFAVAEVADHLPSCTKCSSELEPRQPHFICHRCQTISCIDCFTNAALSTESKLLTNPTPPPDARPYARMNMHSRWGPRPNRTHNIATLGELLLISALANRDNIP